MHLPLCAFALMWFRCIGTQFGLLTLYRARSPQANSAPLVTGGAPAASPAYVDTAHTTMRRVIAGRLAESKRTVPHYYLSVDVGIDRLLGTRKRVRARGAACWWRCAAISCKMDPCVSLVFGVRVGALAAILVVHE